VDEGVSLGAEPEPDEYWLDPPPWGGVPVAQTGM
jgi:hypothetical protein